MQHHVPRAADGSSPYRLAVVKSLEGLPGDVEVVNHNAPGRQYAIVGTVDAIAALGRDARVVPGIDIPFHSSALRGAVDEFRPHVEAAGIDPAALYGRWVPNVLARPLGAGDDVVELLAGSSPRRCAGSSASRRSPASSGVSSRSRPRTPRCSPASRA